MKIGEFRTQMAEALKQLREADSDEARSKAEAEITRLEGEAVKIDAPPQAPDSIEALTEAAPALVERLRETVTSEKESEIEQLREANAALTSKLKDAESFVSGVTTVRQIADRLREAGVTDPIELRHFAAKAQERSLASAEDIRDMVETERAFEKLQTERMTEAARKALGVDDLDFEVEGVGGRRPEVPADGGASFLREAGIPVATASA